MKLKVLLLVALNALAGTCVGCVLPISPKMIDNWFFRERAWERGGAFYERLFHVKAWKTILPELADFVKSAFGKRHIAAHSPEYLLRFLVESCKAELTHWVIVFSSLSFALWNPISETEAAAMVTFLLNLPYIVIQRYNRPRIRRLLVQMQYSPNFAPPARGMGGLLAG